MSAGDAGGARGATTPWFTGKVRRNLVDMHIAADDPRFLASFDPAAYVENLRAARVQVAMIYANSHAGWCHWPTRVGAQHPGLHGRTMLREIFDACHAAGMDVVLYWSLIFDNWAYERFPGARIRDASGRASREPRAGAPAGSRYGVCCPNAAEYRAYTAAQVADFCGALEFEGVFFDMTFWPSVCFCPHCAARFRAEAGRDIPSVVDWSDPRWLAFQERREAWLAEFGAFATEAVRRGKPGATVNHQYSTAQAPWIQGVTERELGFCDYLGGDFYEDFAHQSFFCKLFRSLSPALPYEFHTSRCTDLTDHTTTKPVAELRVMNALTFAHRGATLFIDAIDPAGTMNPAIYHRFGEVFGDTQPLEPFLRGIPREDVAVFYGQDSKYDRRAAPRPADEAPSVAIPHRDAARQAGVTLSRAHVPFGVIGAANLGSLDRHRLLVLPGLQRLAPSDAGRIRAWVERGGALYASGLAAAEALGDLLGVEAEGWLPDPVTYAAPVAPGTDPLGDVDPRWPLMLTAPAARARVLGGAEVAATVVLPFTDPGDPSRFASIHSNPPGRPTPFPAVVTRRVGSGRTAWSASLLGAHRTQAHRDVFLSLLRSLVPGGFSVEADAPPVVEILVYDDQGAGRLLACLVNAQEVLPAVPVHGARVRVQLPAGRSAASARLLPDGPRLALQPAGGGASFLVPRVDVLTMVEITFA